MFTPAYLASKIKKKQTSVLNSVGSLDCFIDSYSLISDLKLRTIALRRYDPKQILILSNNSFAVR